MLSYRHNVQMHMHTQKKKYRQNHIHVSDTEIYVLHGPTIYSGNETKCIYIISFTHNSTMHWIYSNIRSHFNFRMDKINLQMMTVKCNEMSIVWLLDCHFTVYFCTHIFDYRFHWPDSFVCVSCWCFCWLFFSLFLIKKPALHVCVFLLFSFHIDSLGVSISKVNRFMYGK